VRCYDNIDVCVEHYSGAADWNGVESDRTVGKNANMVQVWNINLPFYAWHSLMYAEKIFVFGFLMC